MPEDYKMAAPANEFAWTGGKEEMLIDLWTTKPALFNIECKDYMNRDSKAQARKQIADELHIEGRCG